MKIFASDLDGTLLLEGKDKLETKVIELILELDKSGKEFILATGRSYSELKKLFKEVLYQMYFVCENGALIQFKGNTLYKKTIDKKHASQLIQCMESFGIEWLVAGVHTIYTKSNSEDIIKAYKEIGMPIMRINAIRDLPEEPIRISFRCKNIKDSELVKKIEGQLDVQQIAYDGEEWIDVLHKDVNKSVAIEWICNQLRINRNELVVFGDNYNDREMIEMTPNSYAMSWGKEEIKERANFQTSDVVESIKKLL